MTAGENLAGMAIFAAVVDAGSFSAAAVRLGLSKSAVSKHVSRLEAWLGTRLLNRTTRRLSLTEAGATLYERCARIVTELEEAEAEMGRLRQAPRGVLRVNAPTSFGHRHLAPAVGEFLARYPEVRVDMVLEDRLVDVVEEGFDVAVRIARLSDSSLVARKLAPCRFVVCGSPAYLARHGAPERPEDLARHNCIQYTYQPNRNGWRLATARGETVVRVDGNIRINNGDAQRALLLAGAGLAVLPTFIVGDDLRTGALRAVLPDVPVPGTAVYAVYPPQRHVPPKLRAFIDFLGERFGPDPYWDRGLAGPGPARRRRK